MAKNTNRVLITWSWLSDILAGVGSILDITGSGGWIPYSELDFQPTDLFRAKQGKPPAASRGFLADRDALARDWEKVGNDLREAMNEYRVSIGYQGTPGPQAKPIQRM